MIAVVAFFRAKHDWGEFLYAQFVFTPAYAAMNWSSVSWERIRLFFHIRPLLTAGSVSMFGIATLAAAKSRERVFSSSGILLIVWTLCGLAAAAVQMRGFPVHFFGLLPPASLLAARAFLLPSTSAKPWVNGLAMCGIGAMLVGPIKNVPESRWRASRTALTPDVRLAKKLETLTAPDDTLVVWGNFPSIYVTANRKSASRYINPYWVGETRLGLDLKNSFLREVEVNRPAFFVLEKSAQTPPAMKSPEGTFSRFPELVALIGAHYELWEETVRFRTYRRKGHVGPGGVE